jgi:hypothetical protein
LTEIERKKTDLFKVNPQFVAKQKEDEGTITVRVELPKNVRTETLERNDINTVFGWILEVTFLKKLEVDQSKLLGKRFAHIECTVATTQPLEHHTNPMITKEEDEATNAPEQPPRLKGG